MLKKLAASLVMSGIVATMFAPGALAETGDQTISITTAVDQSILWFDTSVSGSSQDRMVVKVLAPKKRGGGHMMWQRCTFPLQGDGNYRCGIDVAKGSLAKQRGGTWEARAFMDGEIVATTRYSF